MNQAKPVVGLIGGIGSGKSLVAQAFARHGARVISGDQLGHEALRQPAVIAQVVNRWGAGVLDDLGQVQRRKLAELVFADRAERRALEALVFPWIERRIPEEVAAANADRATALIVLDAAVMLEAGWNTVCNWLVYVHAPREVRLRRLAKERGWSPAETAARENAQLSVTEKRKYAQYEVENSGSPEEAERQVVALLRQWGLANPPVPGGMPLSSPK